MPNFHDIRIRRFKITLRQDLAPEWLQDLIDNLSSLPPVDYAPNRYRGIVPAPDSLPFTQLFVKSYSHTDCQHTSLRRTHFIHRLRPRYGYKEGHAYLNYLAKGILTPAPVAFGEEWTMGVRNRGLIVTEAIDAPTVQACLAQPGGDRWFCKAFDMLQAIHAAGLTHGDANLVNFLAREDDVIAIDLENARQITPKKQQSDLVNVLKSYFLVHAETQAALDCLQRYTASGLTLPIPAPELVDLGQRKADKYRDS